MRISNFHKAGKKPKNSVVRRLVEVSANHSKRTLLMPEKLELANSLITGVALPKEFVRK